MKTEYLHIPKQQQLILVKFQELFNLKNITDIGRFLGFRQPYHSAKAIFKQSKPNKYIVKLLEEKIKYNQEVEELKQENFKLKNLY